MEANVIEAVLWLLLFPQANPTAFGVGGLPTTE